MHPPSLPTITATLATPQSAAVIVGCDRVWQNEEMRSPRQDNLTLLPERDCILRSLLKSAEKDLGVVVNL